MTSKDSPPAAPANSTEKVFVGPRSAFKHGARQLVKCGVRGIAVVCYKDQLYAFDNACYHHGGPLLRGEIEEMGGHPCIVCPWHSYKIAMDSGECLYLGIEMKPGGGKPQESVRSKGLKQRVHQVIVEEDGNVYVVVDVGNSTWDSDAYATMELTNRENTMSAPVMGGVGMPPSRQYLQGVSVPLHSSLGVGVRSGHVFQQQRHGSRSAGTNPFDASQMQRPPISPPFSDGSGSATLMVSCVSMTNICHGVKELNFVRHSGTVWRHAELGEYVELELPLADSSAQEGISMAAALARSGSSGPLAVPQRKAALMRRKYTICETNQKGSLFTLLVKAVCDDAEHSGSAWLHQKSLHSALKVCRVGGTFTFADHQHQLRQQRGNVLWLTGGIGLTSAYAALNSSLNDMFFVEGSEHLHVLHLHVHHTLDSIPKLTEFKNWATQFHPAEGSFSAASSLSTAESSWYQPKRKTYTLHLFLTQSPSTQKATTSAEKLSPVRVTAGRRMSGADIVEQVRAHFGADHPLTFLCGPPSFVSNATDALLSMGLPESLILTDDP